MQLIIQNNGIRFGTKLLVYIVSFVSSVEVERAGGGKGEEKKEKNIKRKKTGQRKI